METQEAKAEETQETQKAEETKEETQEQKEDTNETEDQSEETQDEEGEPWEKMSQKELYLKLKQTQTEAKERRKKIAEYENEKYEQRKREMKQKGKTDELNKELEDKLKNLEPKALKWEQHETKRMTEVKETLTKADVWLDSFEKLSLADLENLEKKFKKDSKSPTDSGNKFVANKNGEDKREPWEKMMSKS